MRRRCRSSPRNGALTPSAFEQSDDTSWHFVGAQRLHAVLRRGPPTCYEFCHSGGHGDAKLPALALSVETGLTRGKHLALPSPIAALRHACPVVLEAMVGPLALFYLVLVIVGFRGALIAALVWSCLALGRRLKRGERVSTLLLLGTGLLIIRTVVSFVTGSAFLYFAQPTAGMVVISLVLVGSAVIRRPFTQRFARDFCPIDPELLSRPCIRRFFIRISLLWATVLMLNAGIVLWLLLSSSLRAFVLERTAVTWSLTAAGDLPLNHAFRGCDAPRWGHRRVGPKSRA